MIAGDNVAKQQVVGVQDDFGHQEAEDSKDRAKDQIVEIEEGRLF